MFSASRSSRQVPTRITAETTRLTIGSIQSQPVRRVAAPATTTPAATTASPSMCRKAPRAFRSPLRPDANRAAVKPFTAMPADATAITTKPAAGRGSSRRRTASAITAPVTTRRITPFRSAASTELEPSP